MSNATDGLQETPEPAGLDAILSDALADYTEGAAPVTLPDNPDEAAAAAAKPNTAANRDESGKFAKKSAEAATPSDKEPAATGAKPATDPAIQPAETPQPIEAPARWSEADKAKFATLPREAQEIVTERAKAMEADYTRKNQELAETRKSIEPLIGEVSKLNPLLQQLRYTPQQFIAESGAVANNLLSSDPSHRAGAIAYLVQHRQVPIPELLDALGIPLPTAGDGQQQLRPDPVSAQLHQKVTGLEHQLRQFTERAETEELQRLQNEFTSLGQIKDDKGSAKFPHFDRVQRTMLQLVATNQASTWADAYTKSVRLDDELYQQTLAEERASVAAATEAARLEALDKAKKNKRTVISGGAANGGSKPSGLDAHLTAAMERNGFV